MTQLPPQRLPRTRYMSFPFRIEAEGAAQSERLAHIRERVEQVLFTSPGERVFRPEFGFGARRHVFEPNAPALWEAARNRLYGSLAEALKGDVDPQTLRIEVGAPPGQPAQLRVEITYIVAALQTQESHAFTL
ncbi:GPW/gp25 family protein [Woodsholea maritima]|uniref:GPW/gp25 family protein n=1 Tax=Woodsholea maritima TaxID=240237 RepID=UPI00035F829F|nr:GPW/gp25 family protein [Woodsholea maritima]